MKPKEPIPDTDSIEDLARFWDTHDATDFDDEFEEVTEPLFKRLLLLGPPASSRPAGVSEVAVDKTLGAAIEGRAKDPSLRSSGMPAGSRRSQQKSD